MTEVIFYDITILNHNFPFIPRCIRNKSLHGPDLAAFNGKSNRLYRLALEFTELTGHVSIKVIPGFAALNTVSKLLMNPFKLIHKTINLASQTQSAILGQYCSNSVPVEPEQVRTPFLPAQKHLFRTILTPHTASQHRGPSRFVDSLLTGLTKTFYVFGNQSVVPAVPGIFKHNTLF